MKSKSKLVLVGILIATLVIGVVGYASYLRSGSKGGEVSSKQKTLYQCPMHPTYTSDRKGECPICGMRLVEVKRGDTVVIQDDDTGREGYVVLTDEMVSYPENAKGIVTINLTKQQLIGVRTTRLEERSAVKNIRTVGKIAYDPELYQAEEEYIQAYAAWKKAEMGPNPEIIERAKRLVESSHMRLRLLGLNADLIQEIEKAGAPDGSLILGEPGGKVWLYAPIYEKDLGLVQVGQIVYVTASTILPGKSFQGAIRAIDPILDPKTRSVRIRAEIDNPEGVLKPNIFVNADIEVNLGRQLLIPEDAVLDSGKRQIAFIAKGKGVFVPTLLQLGPKLEDDYVVISGVSKGDEVVSQATFFVDSESKLKAAIGQVEGHEH